MIVNNNNTITSNSHINKHTNNNNTNNSNSDTTIIDNDNNDNNDNDNADTVTNMNAKTDNDNEQRGSHRPWALCQCPPQPSRITLGFSNDGSTLRTGVGLAQGAVSKGGGFKSPAETAPYASPDCVHFPCRRGAISRRLGARRRAANPDPPRGRG